jgi:hypothetical protein
MLLMSRGRPFLGLLVNMVMRSFGEKFSESVIIIQMKYSLFNALGTGITIA